MTPSRRATAVGLVALLAIVFVTPIDFNASSGYDAATLGREQSIDVTGDTSSVLALAEADAVSGGSTSTLVNVTNNFGRTMTFEVRLRPVSQDDADLVVDGANTGDAARFTLIAGGAESVEISVEKADNRTDDTVYFDAHASDAGIEAHVYNRSVPVQ